MDYLNKHFVMSVISSTIGAGFLDGYHSGLFILPEHTFRQWLSKLLQSRSSEPVDSHHEKTIYFLFTLIFLIGGLTGTLLIALIADRLGRKRTLLVANLPLLVAIVTASASKTAESYEMLITARFIFGLCASLSSGVCHMYLMEITPVPIKGAVMCFYHFVFAVSLLLAHLAGLKNVFGNETRWPAIFTISALPAIFQVSTLPFCTESPKFLYITKENEDRSAKALEWLRNAGSTEIDLELKDLEDEDIASRKLPMMRLKLLFKSMSFKSPLILCLVITLSQHLCGMDCLKYYMLTMFQKAGFSESTTIYLILSILVVMAGFSFAGIFFIELIERRHMLLWTFTSLSVVTTIFTFSLGFVYMHSSLKYICVITAFAFVAIYAPGLGPIPWTLPPEVFPHKAKSLAVCLTISANWIASFIVTQAFLPLEDAVGSFLFIVFVVLDFFFFFFVFLYLPELKGKKSVEIFEIFR